MTLRFPMVFDDDSARLPVQVVSLDGLGRGRRSHWLAAVWKIDVEGTELNLIQGAARTLQRSPPRGILCETYDPPQPILKALGKDRLPYRAFIAREPYGLMLGPVGAEQDHALHFSISPTLPVPAPRPTGRDAAGPDRGAAGGGGEPGGRTNRRAE